MKPIQSALTKQVLTILQTIYTQGVTQVVLSPGSRSTPVAILLGKMQDQGLIDLYVDVDERSAAFFALGLAKTKLQPVLLVCTSGTAAANYYPAICEANASHIPLIVLTTDRPPELQDIGAPQTLNQTNFYYQQVKHSWNLPTIDSPNQETEIKYSQYLVQKAIQCAVSSPCGPVHLNLPLRKPLMPNLNVHFEPVVPHNPIKIHNELTSAAFQELQQQLTGKRGLILAGPQVGINSYQDELIEFAKAMNWPLIADSLSNLRDYPQTITTGKWIFQFYQFLPLSMQPEVILRTGGTLVSAEIAAWLKQVQLPIVYLDADHAQLDDTLATTLALNANPATVLPQLKLNPSQPQWLKSWQQLDQNIQVFLQQTVHTTALTEPQIAWTLGQNLPKTAQLFVSNSMPIREIEAYFGHPQANVHVYCNRGVNGIDGVNSTALGMAAAHNQKPAYLYIGDLTFFHDLTGLMLSNNYSLNLTILLQNNNGGGIFSFLPQSQAVDQFEKVFGTPQNLNIKALAQFYQARYYKCTDCQTLQDLIQQIPQGLTIVELPTKRSQLTTVDNQISQQVKKLIQDQNYANQD